MKNVLNPDGFYAAAKAQRCFYVDDTQGNDTYDGLSPQTPWRTTGRANQGPAGCHDAFQPGDHILFRRGGTFVGSLVPKGSGTAEAPIVIASYGDAPQRPTLVPAPTGANGLGPDHVMYKYWYVSTSNTPHWGVDQIRLANVQHYEVRDLELFDPHYAAHCPPHPNDSGDDMATVRYRRGILLYAEDAGHLRGFCIDNMVINGYRGTNSNRGKSAGGIIVMVNTSDRPGERVATSIGDIRITYNHMFNLGRSGLNFTTPWCGRTANGVVTEGDDWGNYNYESTHDTPSGTGGQQQFGWLPSQNVYVGHNIIHDIDGDGILIDNCKDVVVEHNLVYHCHLRCQMAVGIFPWNSDNVLIQFNEVHSTFPAHATGSFWDSQGIEIDALNRDVYVQYNYEHNNAGGTLMNCCTTSLRGFRHFYRYNISQYEGSRYGKFHWMGNCFDGAFYNNTVIFRDKAGIFFNNGSPVVPNRGQRFFNNLFFCEDWGMRLSSFPTPDALRAYTDLEWQHNYFYGFPPELHAKALGGEEKNNLIGGVGDALVENPGGAAMDNVADLPTDWNSGAYAHLKAYMPKAGSPLIGAGISFENVPTENEHWTFSSHDPNQVSLGGFKLNGGKDFFGTPVVHGGRIDIGAVQFVG